MADNNQILISVGLDPKIANIDDIKKKIKDLEKERIKIPIDDKGQLNNINSQIQKLKHTVTDLNKSGTQSTNTWSNALGSYQAKWNAVGGVVANFAYNILAKAGGAILNFFKSGTAAIIKEEQEYKKLLSAVQGDVEMQKELINLAKEKSKNSMYTRGEIIEAEKFLALQGRSTEQIKKMIDASVSLAAVTGEDLNSAMRKLDMTFEGSIGRLGRMDKDFKTLSKTELENGAALDLVIKKYGTYSKDIMDTVGGQQKLLSDSTVKLKKNLVGLFTGGAEEGLSNFTKGINRVVGDINKLFGSTTELSDAMKKQQSEVNALTFQLNDANTPLEQRNKIYNQLLKIAPDVVAGINAENVSTEKLTANLAAYNANMVKKITLQMQSEKLGEAQKKQADIIMMKFDAERELITKMNDVIAETGKVNKEQSDVFKKIMADDKKSIMEKYDAIMTLSGAGTGSSFFANQSKDKEAYLWLIRSTDFLKKAQEGANKEAKNMADLEAYVGETLGINTKLTEENTTSKLDLKDATLEMLQAMLQENQTRTDGSAYTKQEIADINAAIKKKEEETNANKQAYEKWKQLQEEKKKYIEDIGKQIQDLTTQLIQDEQQKEIEELNNTTQQRFDLIKGQTEQENQLRLLMEEKYQQDLAAINQKYADIDAQYQDDLLSEAQKYADENVKIQEDAKQKQSELEQKLFDEKVDKANYERTLAKEIQADKLAATQGGLSAAISALEAFKSLSEGNAKKQKQISIAIATITAIQSAITAYNSAAAVPIIGMVLGPIMAAVALAAGMANVAKIKSTPVGAAAAGGGTFRTSRPTMLMVGDNPGGVEEVNVRPISGVGQTRVNPSSGMIQMAGGGSVISDGGYGSRFSKGNNNNDIKQAIIEGMMQAPAPNLNYSQYEKFEAKQVRINKNNTL